MINFLDTLGKKIDDIFDDNISNWSASLSFFTLFSTIPLLFLILYIFAILPFVQLATQDMEKLIFEFVLPNKVEITKIYFEKFMSSVNTLGIISSLYVLVTSILFFRSFEKIVNNIFKTEKMSFIKSILSFFAMIFLFIFTLLAFVLAKAWFNSELLSFLSIWILFFMIFKISINTKTSTKLDIIVSFFSSMSWYLTKILFVYYVIYNSTYTTLYGPINIIFFMFVWIFVSWYILLTGFKILYKLQHTSITK